ncbi:hypothetical protein HJC23_003289 [Cyclotella cryptica]|uniref:Mitochondrial carrier protein n=1 Tax=Cyclotella cryptica TaxID=29204 RepID=A0ABD3R1E3_9STRA|eukprot:CCRYP_000833-RA/>CCRYP_000833-RA protein AED:0.22 eAED:0.22 QI:0/-1/0/1/-1/1/1/0/382
MASIENSYSIKSIRNGLIAGYSAGLCGIVVGHPLDSIKVLLQTQSDVGVGSCHQSTGAASSTSSAKSSNADTAITRASSINSSSNTTSSSSKANVSTTANPSGNNSSRISANSIIGTRSLRALYSGMTGPLLASGAIRSINFAVYDSVRRALYQRQLCNAHQNAATQTVHHDDYLHYDSLTNVAIASFASGATTSIATSPMALVKTKQQIMVWGFRKAVRDTFFNGTSGKTSFVRGIQNFYTGFGVHFYCDAVGTAVYFTSYEYFKREIARRKQDLQDTRYDSKFVTTHNITLAERMTCAASAGMVCWSVIFPWDVIRSRLYSQAINNETSLNGFQLASQMIREQGLRSLYRGVGITVARAGPVAAAVLPVYDCILSWLSSP